MTDHNYEEWLLARCCVCKGSFTMTEFKDPDLVHTPHEYKCPNYKRKGNAPIVDCECALYAHAACCPECVSLEDQEAQDDHR